MQTPTHALGEAEFMMFTLTEAETHLSLHKIHTRLKIKKGHICFNPFIRVRERERQADTYNTRLVTVCNCLPPHSLSLQTQRETVRLSASPPFLPASLPTLLHPFYDGLLSKLNVLQLSFWTSVKDQNLSLLYTRKNNSIIMEDFRQVK